MDRGVRRASELPRRAERALTVGSTELDQVRFVGRAPSSRSTSQFQEKGRECRAPSWAAGGSARCRQVPIRKAKDVADGCLPSVLAL